MSNTRSERRLVENEAAFRYQNERAGKKFKELSDVSKADGFGPHKYDKSMILHFYCECADENCRIRVPIPLDRYAEIHRNRKRFVIVPGHEVVEVEKVVEHGDEYAVVEKFKNPPDNPGNLKSTDVNNAA